MPLPLSPRQWEVFHVNNCRHTNPPKDKFVVLACFENDWYGFFINSKIVPFFQYNTRLLPCVVKMSAVDYPFLDHDSYLCCNEIKPYTIRELHDFRDTLLPKTITAVLDAVRNCPSLRPHYKRLIGAIS